MAVVHSVRRLIDKILLLDDDSRDADPDVGEPEEPDDEPEQATMDLGGHSVPVETGHLGVLRESRSEFGGMPVVLSRPKTMDDAKMVGERVRDRVPVIMNLEGTDDAMSQRIVDFAGGVVFALQGSVTRIGRAVYICSPADIPLEDLNTEPQQPRTSLFELQEQSEAVGM